MLEDETLNVNSDMVFVTATNDEAPTEAERVYKNRLERIRDTAIVVDEPLFDGEIDLDMGLVSMGSEADTNRIKKSLLDQQKITDASDETRDTIVDEMHGVEAEDVIEDNKLDVNTVPLEEINRRAEKKANSRAVQEILDDLMKTG
jgi:hypothetical protein